MRLVRLKYLCLIAFLGWVPITTPTLSMAATNSVLAGIGGINNGTLSGGDGTGTGQITINIVNLALVKQARDLAGTVLPAGANVNSGSQIYFVLFVDNLTAFTAADIRISDLINEAQFTYVPTSLETTGVPTGSSNAVIWAGVWSALTDPLGGPDDIASITNTGGPAGLDRLTIGAEAGQANQTLNIPGNTLRAIRFRVTVN